MKQVFAQQGCSKRGLTWALTAMLVWPLLACGQKGEPHPASADAPAPAPASAMNGMRAGAAAKAAVTQGEGDTVKKHLAVRHDMEVVLPPDRVETAWRAVLDRCDKLDCEVEASSLRKELNEQPARGDITLRVAPKDLNALLGEIEGQGRVATHRMESEDKTAQVVDVEAHIKNRTEFRDSLRALLKENPPNRKLTEALEIQRTLADVQSELDSYAMQLKALMQETQRQKVDVAFRSEVTLTEGGSANPIRAALRNSVQVMATSFAGLIMTVAAVLPWLIVIVPAIWLIRRMWRGWRERRLARQAAAALHKPA